MKESRTVVLEGETWRHIDRQRGNLSRSRFVEWALKAADKYEDPQAIIRRHKKIIGLQDAELRAWIDTSKRKDFLTAIKNLDEIHKSIDAIIETAISNMK